jgi:hypothetical protein
MLALRPVSAALLGALILLSFAPNPAHADQPLVLPPCPLDPVDPNAPPPPPPPPAPPPLADEPPMPAPAPSNVTPSNAYFQRAALWSKIPNSEAWTAAVLDVVQSRIHDFEQARDVETFCPGYTKASEPQREICWLRLVGSVVEFESSFRNNAKPFCEGNGVYSVGLLSLSAGECPNAMTLEELIDPAKSLTCGVNRMARLINRDHFISSPDDMGASAYWSTLRPAHLKTMSDGRVLHLGKKDEVIARTKLFNRF